MRPSFERRASLVTYMDSHNRRPFEADFDDLGLAAPIRDALIDVFERKLAPRGAWNSSQTAKGCWYALKAFAAAYSQVEGPPQSVGQISVGLLKQTRLMSGPDAVRMGIGLLVDHAELRPDVRDYINRRHPKRQSINDAITASDLTELRKVIYPVVESIRLRIERATQQASSAGNTGMEALLQLIVEKPFDVQAHVVAHRKYQRLVRRQTGGAAISLGECRRMLHPTFNELSLIAFAIILETGWNLSSVLALDEPLQHREPGTAHRGHYSVTLTKLRRGRNLVEERRDWKLYDRGSRADVLTKTIAITRHSRAALALMAQESNRLLVGLDGRAGSTTLNFAVLPNFYALAMKKEWPHLAYAIAPGRVRRAVNALERRAVNQNTRETHDVAYVLSNPAARENARKAIADGAAEALADAISNFKGRLVNDSERLEATEIAFSGCSDPFESPFSRSGQLCGSSVLMCFACRNALVSRSDLPKISVLYDSLAELRSVLGPADWESRWSDIFARIGDMRTHAFSEDIWARARETIGPADRELVQQVLNGEFDG